MTTVARRALLLAASAGLGLASCGLAAARGAGRVSSSTTTRPPARERPAAVSPPERRVLARRQARRQLGELRLPAGWQRSSGPPEGSGSLLRMASQTPGSPNLVDLHRFYVDPMTSARVLAWIESNLPSGSRLDGTGTSGNVSTGPDLWELDVSWPTSRTVFDTAQLVVAAVNLSGGRTALRVDSQVVWLPAKSRADFLPSRVTTVTATVPSTQVRPVTSSDPRVIAALRRAIAALPVMPGGTFSCPADFAGATVRLSFGRPGAIGGGRSSPSAVVTADRSGCGTVSISVDRRAGTTLWDGARIVRLAERLLGLHLSAPT